MSEEVTNELKEMEDVTKLKQRVTALEISCETYSKTLDLHTDAIEKLMECIRLLSGRHK